MTGLELMQAMLDGKLPPPSIAVTIPMQGEHVEAGRVVFRARALLMLAGRRRDTAKSFAPRRGER